jgi:ABC-2 type transport system permease protein
VTALRWTARAFRYEQTSFWRTPGAPVFTVGMPLVMLAIFGALNRDDTISQLRGVPVSRYLVVGLVSFTLATTAYGMLSARVTFRRETGIYQRLRTTPLPASAFVAGQVATAITVVAATVALLLGVGVAFYDGSWPADWPLFLLVVLLGSACCCSIGLAVSTFVPSAEAIDAVVWGTVMPVTFISGTFQYVPPDSLLGRIGGLFPVRHILDVSLEAFDLPGSPGAVWRHLAVIVAWTAVAGVVAVRRFRWAPRRS